MGDKKDCKVHLPANRKVGVFANAFRVLPDSGDEILLDFCVFSQHEQQADVVARIRVHKNFLLPVRDRINAALGIGQGQAPDPSLARPPEETMN